MLVKGIFFECLYNYYVKTYKRNRYADYKATHTHTHTHTHTQILHSDKTGDLLLASCAQDSYIRLWRVTKDCNIKETGDSTVSSVTTEEDEGDLKLTGNVFSIVDDWNVTHQYTVTLESVLMGKVEAL